MKKKCISLLIILFIVACDQRMISIKSGIKTMVTAPLTLLKDTRNIITGNTYDKLKTNTQKNEENEDLVTVKCNNIITASIIDSPEEIKKLSSEVRKHACSCEVWGTCPKNICSCDKLCPWSLSYLEGKIVKILKITHFLVTLLLSGINHRILGISQTLKAFVPVMLELRKNLID